MTTAAAKVLRRHIVHLGAGWGWREEEGSRGGEDTAGGARRKVSRLTPCNGDCNTAG